MNLIKRLPMLVVLAAAAWLAWTIIPATNRVLGCASKNTSAVFTGIKVSC